MPAWFYLIASVAIITLTATKPRWFWHHPKALFLRNSIGDRPTAMFYYLIGSFGIVFALWKLSLR